MHLAGAKKRLLRGTVYGLFLAAAQSATAGPDACPGYLCQGNQSAGINLAPPPNALTVSA
jgi:hypothetical protein